MNEIDFSENAYCGYNPSLDDDEKNDPNPFPEKMAKAVAFFEKNGLPPDIERSKTRKKATHSTLQNELLTVFSLDPSEAQMQELKAFLYQLFGEQIKTATTKKEVEMA
jgi:hypothetical protein